MAKKYKLTDIKLSINGREIKNILSLKYTSALPKPKKLIMKKLLLIVCVLYSLGATGQNKNIPQYDTIVTKNIDGEKIILGTQGEYREQIGWEATGKQYGNEYLCRYIGFKSYWLGHIVAYMDDKLNLALTNSLFDKKTKTNTFVFQPHASVGTPKKTFIKVKGDEDDRIKSMTFYGDLYNLVYLFLWYWPSSATAYSESNFKKGKLFYKYVYLEKISFDWTGSEPMLKITKEKGVLGE